MQYHAIPLNSMQYNPISCNTMQYHASLITADGAYHCPVGSIMAIFIIIPNIQLSRHQETKIQALFKTTPQQLINLIHLLPFWNQFNQTELMFSPLIAPSFPQVLYTLWKTYKQAKVFFSSKIRLKIPVACHLNGAVQVNNVNFPQPRLTHAPTYADYRRFSAKFRRFMLMLGIVGSGKSVWISTENWIRK